MPMLTLVDVGKAYGGGPLLFAPVTATFAPGACVSIRGPHGVGKSTLLRIIAGLERPTVGKRHLEGVALGGLTFHQAVSLILPEHRLLPSRTVVENLVLSQRLTNHPRRAAVDAAYRLLQRIDLLRAADRFPDALSRGEHQLACIARAVLRRPRLILADEPGEGLRPAAAEAARGLLAHAGVQGACVVMASTAGDRAAPEPTEVITLIPPRVDAAP